MKTTWLPRALLVAVAALCVLDARALALDYGDAPSRYASASHSIMGPFLGATRDADSGPQPHYAAMGDDLNDTDDEDGVAFPARLARGVTRQVSFTVGLPPGSLAQGAFVTIWFDWNANGIWGDDASEVYGPAFFAPGMQNVDVTPPATAALGATFARFRISEDPISTPDGQAETGEVEDYLVVVHDQTEPPYKWVQYPDLTYSGMDIRAQEPLILADDFRCNETGPITNIVVWGSWYKDLLPYGNPSNVTFTLSFHNDIPAQQGQHSRPGDVLWHKTFAPGSFQVQPYGVLLDEGWYNPFGQGFYDPQGDTICWQYTFPVSTADAFVQTGRWDRSVIYWLDVQATHQDVDAQFGWKTTLDHWNDAAVWGNGTEPYPGPWNPLFYPPGHELEDEPIDLAFALMGDPSPEPIPPGFKWFQPPDLTENGFDVECMKNRPILLADDFCCTNRGAITNIIVWGSWLSDVLPMGPQGPNAGRVTFTLSIHSDRPAGSVKPWSMPGPILWWTNFPPGTFTATIDSPDGLKEGWYDPMTGIWTPNADWTCWRYEFPIDIARAFVQTGTVDNPITYWLDVQAEPLDLEKQARFGWKTTRLQNRWNDDACWVPETEPYNGTEWLDLHYPPGHPYHELQNNSFDLAFALRDGPVPEEEPWDFGDAPEGLTLPGGAVGAYPTMRASNGARHKINPALFLGAAIDADPDGQPTLPADGDDINPLAGPDDEDGVVFTSRLYAGLPASLQITSSGTGYLSAWLDFRKNGNWSDPGEQVIADLPLLGGVTNISFNVPSVPPAKAGLTYMRFRFSTVAGLTDQGAAPDGEVEDYQVDIDEIAPDDDLDFGDADAPFPTLRAANGAGHVITALCLGATVDRDNDGQPSPNALGDDHNILYPGVPFPPGDEDGVAFPTAPSGQPSLVRGSNMTVTVNSSGVGYLNAWMDFTRDGDWNDPGEKVCAAWPLVAGPNPLTVTAPPHSMVGPSTARFRCSTVPMLHYTGLAPDGEVEDHAFVIYQLPPSSPTNIVISNIVFAVTNGAWLDWRAQSNLLTHVLYCTNLTDSSWSPLGTISTNREYLDNDATNRTPSFYRVVAPYVWP
jgi:hypothetical protein